MRADAPWCPDNIEFIRRINGLESREQVRDIVFGASYLVMGLGDVYLGAPVATPLDPRHRLVTTKYNPARTWTPENAVGIGGAYLCVYGMEGPGGYQFVGRTVQMWNRYRQTADFRDGKQWLLRFFDQIRFYPVSGDELLKLRAGFPYGRHPLRIEESHLDLGEYLKFLEAQRESIDAFRQRQRSAFDAERERWRAAGLAETPIVESAARAEAPALPEDCVAITSPVSGSVWQIKVAAGQAVEKGDTLVIMEAMKMEIAVLADTAGTVHSIHGIAGAAAHAGDTLLVLQAGAVMSLDLTIAYAGECLSFGRADAGSAGGEAAGRTPQACGPQHLDQRCRRRGAACACACSSTRHRSRRRCRCTAFRSPSRTTSTSPACRPPRAAPRSPINPQRPHPVVQALIDAGAIALGKTNLDQFATGLVGTRSPYGDLHATRSIPRTSAAVPRAAPRWPWRWDSPASRWAPTPPAPAACRRHSTTWSATSRRWVV